MANILGPYGVLPSLTYPNNRQEIMHLRGSHNLTQPVLDRIANTTGEGCCRNKCSLTDTDCPITTLVSSLQHHAPAHWRPNTWRAGARKLSCISSLDLKRQCGVGSPALVSLPVTSICSTAARTVTSLVHAPALKQG